MSWSGVGRWRRLGRAAHVAVVCAIVLVKSGWSLASVSSTGDEFLASMSDVERQAWRKIIAGEEVKLSCSVDQGELADRSDCRIRAAFLVNLLTQPVLTGKIQAAGVRITGARIEGDLNLSRLRIGTHLALIRCIVPGHIQLDGTQLEKEFALTGSHIGSLRADSLYTTANLVMRDVMVAGTLNLIASRIDGQFSVSRAFISGNFECPACTIGKGLFLRDAVVTGPVVLPSSHIKSALVFTGARFRSSIDLSNADLETTAYLNRITVSDDVVIENSRIGGNLNVSDSKLEKQLNIQLTRIDGYLDGQALQLSGHLLAQSAKIEQVRLASNTFSALVDFQQARIAGAFSTSRAMGSPPDWLSHFHGPLNLDGAQIGGNLSLVDAKFSDVSLVNAHIEGGANLRGLFESAIEAEGLRAKALMLSGTYYDTFNCNLCQIAGHLSLFDGEFRAVRLRGSSILGGLSVTEPPQPVSWVGDGSTLDLTDASIGWVDAKETSLPRSVKLAGTSYKRLSRLCGLPDALDQQQSRDCLRDLLRDRSNADPSTYSRLATYLRQNGNKALADDIIFESHNRSIGQARYSGDWGEWFRLVTVRSVIGFGIGDYAFRIFGLTGILVGISTAILYSSVSSAKQKGLVWCAGASLHRLLPVVDLSKEFSDFFDDPNRDRLTGWQTAFFIVLAGLGWLIGLFAVGAITGLAEK